MNSLLKCAVLSASVISSAFVISCSSSSSRTQGREKITILPVEKISDDFVMGVDVSSLVSVEKSGGKFFDAKGKSADPISLLKEGGANCVRIRVWNDPFDAGGNGYGGGNNDIDTAVEIGKRATKLGLGVLIDFHYSDFWADPNKQTAPKAWKNFSVEQKASAMEKFTTESLQKLKDAGVNVKMVQVGNEINNGLAGEIYDDQVHALLNAGCNAVRKFDKSLQIVIHFTDPLSEGYLEHKAKLLEKYGVDYDILATSYYPYWHGDVKKLSMTLKKVSNLYKKKVMVAETSYPFTDDDGDGFGNVVSTMSANQEFRYPFTVEGQAIAVRDVIEAVANIKNGVGVFYWEPAWIPVKKYDANAENADEIWQGNYAAWEKFGSGWASSFAAEYDKEVKSQWNGGTWDNQAFFDFDGKCLESINVFNYARTGSKGKLDVVRVESPSVEFTRGKQGELPKTIKVTYNDGSERDEEIEWNKNLSEKVLNNPDFGEYKIPGTLKNGHTSTCVVTVTASNFLVNGNFEKGDTSGWEIINPLGKGTPKVDKNNQNAKEGLCYFTAWEADDFEFDIQQTVTSFAAGEYQCFASFEGTGITNPCGTKFIVIVKSKDGSEKVTERDVEIPNVWKKFFRAEVSGIHLDENTESITVKIHVKAEFDPVSGANGAWFVMDDVNLLLAE
jgi:arabinogalactan endo-1,4-beta-galactosidase